MQGGIRSTPEMRGSVLAIGPRVLWRILPLRIPRGQRAYLAGFPQANRPGAGSCLRPVLHTSRTHHRQFLLDSWFYSDFDRGAAFHASRARRYACSESMQTPFSRNSIDHSPQQSPHANPHSGFDGVTYSSVGTSPQGHGASCWSVIAPPSLTSAWPIAGGVSLELGGADKPV